MNLFALSGLSVGIACLVLTSSTLLFGKTKLHRAFMLFNLVVAVWGFGIFFVGISRSEMEALYAWKVTHAGGFFIGPSFYYLISVFCGVQRKKLLFVSYQTAMIFLVLLLSSDLLFKDLRSVHGLYYLVPNPLYTLAFVLYLAIVLASYIELLRFFPKVKGHTRAQTLYLIFGFLFGFTGGTFTFLPVYGIDILYQYGNFGITLYCLVLGYAILRLRLMDFHLAFKKSLVYSLSAGLLTGLFVIIVVTLTRYLSGFAGVSSFGITIVAALIIAFVFAPLREQIQILVDRLFSRSAYDYYTVVRNTSRELLSSMDLEKISGLVVNTVFQTLKLKRVLLLSAKNGVYETIFFVGAGSEGPVSKEPSAVLKTNSPLVVHLNSNGIVLKEELQWTMGESEARNVSSQFELFDGEAAVPIIIEGKPDFLLILGEKLSGDPFSSEDISLLGTISNQAAIALKNAKLYAELKQSHEDLKREIDEHARVETEKQELKEKLIRSEKMEAIGRLAGGVAHDLNNVLSAIVGYPDLMLAALPADSPHRRYINTVKKSGLKAAAIVQDLLTLARRGVSTKEVINLNQLVAEYLNSPECEKLRIYHPGVVIRKSLEDDLWNLEGSSIQMFKTIMNLISNAAEALPSGGEVVISTSNRTVAGDGNNNEVTLPKGDYVVLKISDNGIGITKEECEKIFEPFFTKKSMGRSGTGLGMAVVWGAVQDHHGTIDVQSKEGEGTTFAVSIPRTLQRIRGEDAIATMKDFMGNGEKILVVDDIKEQREFARELLVQLGYTVETASRGEEAVEYVKDNNVDLMILDMIMDPGIDGLDTYRQVLELRPGTKAIIASGYSETERVRETIRLGAGAYIMKPFTLNKIGTAVRTELNKQSASS